MNAAIITARAGSKSIANKNVFPVGGCPLVAHPIKAASASKVDRVYVSTDCPMVAEIAEELGCIIIDRPDHLRGDEVNHGDVIRHAVERINGECPSLRNVVVLLGNTVMVDAPLIDQSLQMLDEDESLDSVMSVWEAADDHPLRAMELHRGCLRPYGGARDVSTNRQAYPSAYFFDQGVWTFRKQTVKERTGPNPWWWMGRHCKPIVRTWVTGRDIHNILDVSAAEWWLKEGRHA